MSTYIHHSCLHAEGLSDCQILVKYSFINTLIQSPTKGPARPSYVLGLGYSQTAVVVDILAHSLRAK